MNINSRISSNLVFGVESGATDLKIFPQVNSMGIVVQDNASFTVGSAGMLAFPVIDSTPPGADAAWDAAFGDHIGSHGAYVVGSSSVLFAFKAPDGHWYGDTWTRVTVS